MVMVLEPRDGRGAYLVMILEPRGGRGPIELWYWSLGVVWGLFSDGTGA